MRLLLTIIAGLLIVPVIALGGSMAEAKYTLSNYDGVGSGVFKHGTIIKLVDDKPVIVGSFNEASEYPGTLQIEDSK